MVLLFISIKTRKRKKAAVSKIAMILKRNASPRSAPQIKKRKDSPKLIFLKILIYFSLSTINKPATRIGRSMKFSEFAIFPSSKGIPKSTAKIEVAKSVGFELEKSFLERAKKIIIDKIPKIRETSLTIN